MSSTADLSSGAANTPWLANVHSAHPRLTGEIEVDVAVIGGGIAGLSVAYELSQEGRKVAVLEDGVIGSGETGRTTAHLASALDDGFSRLERLHGERGAQFAYRSHAAAIDEIERIVRKEKIDCDFERLSGYLFIPSGASVAILDAELECAKRLGFRGVQAVERAPIPGFDTGPCVRFPDQGQLHPVKYLAGLAKAVVRLGGKIYEHSHVEDYELGERATLKVVGGGKVRASSMVVATNAPIVSMFKFPLKQFAYRSYAISLAAREGSIPKALYWDTADPYHYARVHGGLLIVGGEDHKTGQPGPESPDARYDRLEAWTRERFPGVGRVVDRWSGQVMEPADGLAYIGRYRKAGDLIYVATGDSGHGMTHGTIAGLLIRDLIVGRSNPWATIYDPDRASLRSMGEILAENLNVLPQYAKWLSGGDDGTPRELAPGEGRVFRHGLKKLAVCRNEKGELCTLSAICPHLGAIVTWNAAEKTWDCPAHGSRFSADGQVLNGPANTDLTRIRVSNRRKKPKASARKS